MLTNGCVTSNGQIKKTLCDFELIAFMCAQMYVMSLLKLRLLHFYKLMLFANGRVTKRGFVGLGWIAF